MLSSSSSDKGRSTFEMKNATKILSKIKSNECRWERVIDNQIGGSISPYMVRPFVQTLMLRMCEWRDWEKWREGERERQRNGDKESWTEEGKKKLRQWKTDGNRWKYWQKRKKRRREIKWVKWIKRLTEKWRERKREWDPLERREKKGEKEREREGERNAGRASYDNEKHRVRKKLISSPPYRDSNQCPAILLNFRLKWLVKVRFQVLNVKETSCSCFRTHDLLLSGHPCTVAPTQKPRNQFLLWSWHIRAPGSWNDDKRGQKKPGSNKSVLFSRS